MSNKVNMKITVIVDDLDKPGEDPIKLVDELQINMLDCVLNRPVKREMGGGFANFGRPVDMIPGPITGNIHFKEEAPGDYVASDGEVLHAK